MSAEKVEVAEWSKAVDSGSIPKGRGFESRPQHFFLSLLSHILKFHHENESIEMREKK